jgi:hypothetical protein
MSLLSLVTPLALGYIGLQAWRKKVGDARVSLRTDQVRQPQVYFYPGNTHALLSCRLPMRNTGKQQALVIDARALLQPSGDRYSDLQPVCRLINLDSPRLDGYWEAFIVPVGGEVELEIRLNVTSTDGVAEKLAEMGAVRFDLHYKYYCRTPMHYCKNELIIPVDQFVRTDQRPAEPSPPPSKPKAPVDPQAATVPLRTHLVRPGESVLELVQRYAVPVGKPGDMVALAETVVAIMQNRMAYCEDIKPRWLARELNVLFGMHSSLSSPYSLEMAMREVGVGRILLAMAAGILGKVTRRPGDFYRLAGRGVAAIDDCTGTLPPFDKHVVMGPAKGDQLVMEIKEKTGMDACIVDANDLGKVDIFHISDPARSQEVVDALKPNPQGNAAEMTPLVLIRGSQR